MYVHKITLRCRLAFKLPGEMCPHLLKQPDVSLTGPDPEQGKLHGGAAYRLANHLGYFSSQLDAGYRVIPHIDEQLFNLFPEGIKVMTAADIFIQILHETTGKPIDEIKTLVTESGLVNPEAKALLDKELSDQEVKKLFDAFRADPLGPLAWLAKGAANVSRITGTS